MFHLIYRAFGGLLYGAVIAAFVFAALFTTVLYIRVFWGIPVPPIINLLAPVVSLLVGLATALPIIEEALSTYRWDRQRSVRLEGIQC